MSLRDILDEAEGLAVEAMETKSDMIHNSRNFPIMQGVYLISKKNQVIYIGQAKNLRKRLNQHLEENEDASRSAFRRALGREFRIAPLKTKEWIVKNCRVAAKEIENPDMCKLVESL